jgi:hypothetical protein
MLEWLLSFCQSVCQWLLAPIFTPSVTHRLVVVRRYADANGNYVGELYIEQKNGQRIAYTMIGVSLDSLPFNTMLAEHTELVIDTKHDFLYLPMHKNTLRVGALHPADNDAVRKLVASFNPKRIVLSVENRFIQHIMSNKL